MRSFILLLFVGIGAGSDKEANSLTSIEFSTQARCEAAGKAAEREFSGGTKRVRWVCAEK